MIAEKLQSVTSKALDVQEKILDMELPSKEDESFGVILKAKNQAAATILSTQTKVDENLLRKQQNDNLDGLLREIAEFEKAHPRRIGGKV